MIHFLCPFCRKSMKARDSHAGKKCKCISCQLLVDIPGDPAEEEPLLEPDAPELEVPNHQPELELPVHQEPFTLHAPRISTAVPFIQGFLILIVALLSIATGIVLYQVLDHGKGIEKWIAFGYFVGAWMGCMLFICAIWLLSEIVVALHQLRKA